MSFKTLNLSPKLLTTLEKLGYVEPTEIQRKAIPLLLKRKDLLATSQTGTGKTAGFVLPLLENLEERTEKRTGDARYQIDALILAPTRELVVQIAEKIESYGENFSHSSVALYGGIKLGSQVSAIRSGANIAVGTTARVLDHIKNKSLKLDNIKVIILDEADKMLEMGFIDEIRKILAQLPKERHSIMFSATFPKPILSLAKSFLNNPSMIEIDRENLSAQQVKQSVYLLNEEEKMPQLIRTIVENDWHQVLVFTNTKLQADKIVEQLKSQSIKTSAIHGDKSQGMRTEALKGFKSQKIRVLVATDVAARGIDIINLPYVINFELPLKNEDYIHRVGRTGRASQEGEALSLVCKREEEQLKEIEELINKKLEIISESVEEKRKVPTSRESRKKLKKQGVDLKKAKALAEKMMGNDPIKGDGGQKKGKKRGEKPSNKRHF